uniref:Ig-like domain-containing protein n=1 Tax=Glossina brevipalpis TaxID=37001 RepID=A0A1A9WUN5_9MUSC
MNHITNSLTMTEVKIPNHIMRFKSAILGCRYNLDGESLYSVKWYKDGHEFYRYVPRNKPPGQAFPLPGINVDVKVVINDMWTFYSRGINCFKNGTLCPPTQQGSISDLSFLVDICI